MTTLIDSLGMSAYLLGMQSLDKFIEIIKSELPENRLTYQKTIATVHPESAEEAAVLFKLANKYSQPVFITGFGNNIDPIGEPFVDMISIRTDRLNDLQQVRAEDFYVVVGSGYPLREINADIEARNLWLPHSSLPYVGSVGGAVAAGLAAELNGHDLPLKKYLIKAEIVTPLGEIVKPGSVCFKSVSGYDIVKVFAGSWGLLGLIVSATFRVMPLGAREEFAAMKQKEVDRRMLLTGLQVENNEVDAIYSRKVKASFDPVGVLPVV